MTPALDVAAIVAALPVGEVRPWSRVDPGSACLFVGKQCVWSGPLERIGEDMDRFKGADLALHPDDVAALHAAGARAAA